MKDFFVRAFAVLFLLGFIALSVYLAFFMDGIWVSEDGGAVNQAMPRLLILLFFGALPLFLLLWILFPKTFNKLLFKGLNKGLKGGAGMMERKERCEELSESSEPLPYICKQCGFVLESTAKFCTNCGTAKKD